MRKTVTTHRHVRAVIMTGHKVGRTHKIGSKLTDRTAVEFLGGALLFDATFVDQHNHIADGKGFFLVVGDVNTGDV